METMETMLKNKLHLWYFMNSLFKGLQSSLSKPLSSSPPYTLSMIKFLFLLISSHLGLAQSKFNKPPIEEVANNEIPTGVKAYGAVIARRPGAID